ACHQAGGGIVIIPKGAYFVKGPIHLQSNVNLHLDAGAVIKFSTDPDDYLPLVLTRYEGIELMNYSPLIYAYGQENIAVTGKGVLDGQADNEHWWNWTGSKKFGWKEGMPSMKAPGNRPALAKMAAEGVPVEKRIFGNGHYLRPSFLEFYRCKNILVQGVTIKNTPFWILHPTLSQNVTVDGVTTISHGPNNDGCDPESCTDVLIKNCFFSNGDDCIAIKSGRDEDGRRINIPSRNIIVENCQMRDGHCGVGIGSETSGGVENVFAQNCEMNSPNLDRAIRIKSNACRGGVLKGFYFRDIQVGQVREAVVRVNMFYGNEEGPDCHFPPSLNDVYISNVTSQKSEYAVYIAGRKDKPAGNIVISNCSFNHVAKKNIIENVNNFKIVNTTINGEKVNQ
ncbi:MAG: glycoside hydrolase family 28 protein, partial [Chitinophagaceae bacterium]